MHMYQNLDCKCQFWSWHKVRMVWSLQQTNHIHHVHSCITYNDIYTWYTCIYMGQYQCNKWHYIHKQVIPFLTACSEASKKFQNREMYTRIYIQLFLLLLFCYWFCSDLALRPHCTLLHIAVCNTESILSTDGSPYNTWSSPLSASDWAGDGFLHY